MLGILLTVLLQTAEPRTIAPVPVVGQIGLQQGMPSAFTLAVYQDAAGFIWISTVDGLVRVEGNDLTVLRHDPEDPDSLPSSYIHQTFMDRQGRMWVAADTGLVRLAEDLKVAEYIASERFDGPLPDDHLWNVAEDCHGFLWLTYYRKGLVRYEPERREFRHFTPEMIGLPGQRFHPMSLSLADDCRLWIPGLEVLLVVSNTPEPEFHSYFGHWTIPAGADRRGVVSVLTRPDGRVWIGTENGIYVSALTIDDPDFGTRHDQLTHLVGSGGVTKMIPEDDDRVWVIAAGSLQLLSRDGGVLVSMSADEGIGLPTYRLIDGIFDNEGALWIASLDQGVLRLAPSWRAFQRYLPAGEASAFSADNRVTALIPGYRPGQLLYARHPAGIERLDLQSGEVTVVYRADGVQSGEQPSVGVIRGLYEDERGAVWFSSAFGLYHLENDGAHPQLVYAAPNQESAGLRTIWPADDGRVWIQTRAEGLFRFDPSTRQFEYWHGNAEAPYQLNGTSVRFLTRDAHGAWWLGTERGLHRSADGLQFEYLERFPDRAFNALHLRGSELWLAGDGALERWDIESAGMTARYTVSQGLPAGRILNIHEAHDGLLWLPMSVGLTRFDPERERFRLLGVDDGVRAGEFVHGHSYLVDDDVLVAGIADGLVVARLGELSHEPPPPGIHIRRMWAGERAWSANPAREELLELPYDHNTVQFELFPVTYFAPESSRIRMQLVGWDEQWINHTGRSRQTYSRLPPGRYRFQAQAAGRDGTWGETSAEVAFVIYPPPWRTSWAYAGYVLGAVLLVGLLIRGHFRRRMRRLQLEAARQASRAKSDFLAMISHEIRTPMHGVMGMVELLRETPLEPRQQDMLRTLHRSGAQLLGIVNDTLDLSRIEAGHIEFDHRWIDLPALLDELIDLHAASASQAGLKLYLLTSRELPLQVLGDPLRISQILGNMLNNAIKFTRSGWVQLSARSAGTDKLLFTVTDTGPGMTAEQMNQLFVPFTQLDTSITRRHSGTGLGLTICRRLARAMDGEISIQSQPGVGSRFTLAVPLAHQPGFSAPTRLLAGRTAHVLASAPLARAVRRLLTRWGAQYRATGQGPADWVIVEAARLHEARQLAAGRIIVLSERFEGGSIFGTEIVLSLPITERRLIAALLDEVIQSSFMRGA